ncbi:MAG: hypothetical protein AAGF94_11195 [Pseudomonadota bacterium]
MTTEGGAIHFDLIVKADVPGLSHHCFPQLVHEHERLYGAYAAPLGPRSPAIILDIQIA